MDVNAIESLGEGHKPRINRYIDHGEELLHGIFKVSAGAFPQRTALRLAQHQQDAQSELTYAELWARAARFAAYLRSRGITRADRVVIILPRGFDQYMVILGVLEVGAAYVPLDWSCPELRANYVVNDCGAAAIVTNSSKKTGFAQSKLIVLDEELGDIAALDPKPLNRASTSSNPTDLAYIIYTSGSSGTPKGVMISHANITFQIRSEGAILGVRKDDIVYAGASLAFDVSLEEMWAAFGAGATLLVGTEALDKNPLELGEILGKNHVTIWFPVPSLLTLVQSPIRSLRLLNVGGEPCSPELARRWAGGTCRMINTYGPTETSVSATWAELSPNKKITIGRPLPGFLVWVVDETMKPVANGNKGELVIGGPAVGSGYLNLPELTREKFVTLPTGEAANSTWRAFRTGDLVSENFDGELEYHGRIDLQVKIRGHRVELGEIEVVLSSDPAVAQAVVNLYNLPNGSQKLVAFLVARNGQNLEIERLRTLVGKQLPASMWPNAYRVLAALPTLISGKIDRASLELPEDDFAPENAIEPPSDLIERKLLDIWKKVFSLSNISVTDDFFKDLAGHSLLAARTVSSAREDPCLSSISINHIYAAPTIKGLAQIIKTERAGENTDPGTFRCVPQSRYLLCICAQTLALLLIFTFAGLQWILPYIAYTVIATPETSSRVSAIFGAMICFAAMPPTMLLFSIVIKWVVIGRYRSGDYPIWGSYYFRWWFVRRFLAVVPTNFLSGTPLMAAYLRMLGVKIGKQVFTGLESIDAHDLVTIGSGAILSEGVVLSNVSVEKGLLRIGHCKIGDRASIGAMSVVGRNAEVGDDAILDSLSALSAGQCIPDHEFWTGSPAGRQEAARSLAGLSCPSNVQRILVTFGLLVSAALLPLAAVLPIAPALMIMMEMDWDNDGYNYLVFSPVLAFAYVVAMCTFIAAIKWLLLGKLKPGIHSIWSWFYIRFWFLQKLGVLALELLNPLYSTLYIGTWLRILGAKVGERAEISTASSVIHDLIDIGKESFLADGVIFGAAQPESNSIRLSRTAIGHRSFIGNSALLPSGTDIGNEVLIGVLSKPPTDREAVLERGSTWFGSPAIRLLNRQVAVQFNEGARFKPSKSLVAMRLAIEYVRVTLPLTVFISLFCILLSIIGDLSELPHGALWIAALFPVLYLGFVLAVGLFVVGLKWAVVGRYVPTTAPLWSLYVWRNELVTSAYENLVVPLLLEHLRGTPYLNAFLRLLGCKIGKRVFMDTTDITEPDLISIGDYAAVNEDAGLQTHLFEDRVMKVSSVTLGKNVCVGTRSIVLYDALIEDGAQLGDLSVLMKGEKLPAGTSWEGSPVRVATRLA